MLLAAFHGLIASGRAAEEIVVRSSVSPEQALVGQRVILRVEVLGRDGWARIERTDNFEAAGAFILKTQTQGTRIQETIGGSSYTGQRYELSLYPQRPGDITIRPVPAQVSNRSWGLNAGESMHEVEVPGVTLAARYPPGAENLRGLVTTTGLEARQEWNSEAVTVRVGEALERRFHFSARDIPGMAFLPLQHAGISSVGIYPGEPLTEDRTDRGVISGRRTESVTYVFEQPGEVTLPAFTVNWWDLSANALRQIELPGRVVHVEPAAIAAGGDLPPDPGEESTRLVSWASLVLVAGFLLAGILIRAFLWNGWRKWLHQRREGERFAFRLVLEAFQSADPALLLRRIMRWIDLLEGENGPGRLDAFLERHANPETRQTGLQLAAMATGLEATRLAEFRHGLIDARKNWKQSRRMAVRHRKVAQCLPKLN